MASSKRTVVHLAHRAGIAADLALDLLRDAGLRVRRPQDHISGAKMGVAERALDLARPLPPPKHAPQPSREPARPPAKLEEAAPQAEPLTRAERRNAGVEIVGRRERLSYLSFEDVQKIHWKLVEDFKASRDPIDPPGIASENLLHSALTRSHTSLGRDLKYPTASMAAAALLHSLIHNHPFHNGNKRTALVAMLVFLDKNNWSLRVESDDELFEFVISVGRHTLVVRETASAGLPDAEVAVVANWLQRRMRPTSTATRAFKFHDLRTLLLKYECHFDQPKRGNRINIRRGHLVTQVWYGGDGREVRAGTVPKIRRELQLDEEHGYDSEMFYNAEERLPGFIMKYRHVLDKLAKM